MRTVNDTHGSAIPAIIIKTERLFDNDPSWKYIQPNKAFFSNFTFSGDI